jgi:hypothetical protein
MAIKWKFPWREWDPFPTKWSLISLTPGCDGMERRRKSIVDALYILHTHLMTVVVYILFFIYNHSQYDTNTS